MSTLPADARLNEPSEIEQIRTVQHLLQTCKAVQLIIYTATLTTGKLQSHEIDKINQLLDTTIAKAEAIVAEVNETPAQRVRRETKELFQEEQP